METVKAYEEWRFACQSRNYSPKSLAWNDKRIRDFTAWLASQGVAQIEEVRAAHVHHFLVSLPNHYADTTRRGYAQAVKAWLNYCANEDLIGEKIPKRISMPRITQKVIQTFTPDQVKRLMAACEREVYPWMRARDRAILTVLLDCGLRASELCNLKLKTFTSAPRTATSKCWARVGASDKWGWVSEAGRASSVHLPPPERAREPAAGIHQPERRDTGAEWAAPVDRAPA